MITSDSQEVMGLGRTHGIGKYRGIVLSNSEELLFFRLGGGYIAAHFIIFTVHLHDMPSSIFVSECESQPKEGCHPVTALCLFFNTLHSCFNVETILILFIRIKDYYKWK